MSDPLRIPGSATRSALIAILGSVPTALTDVAHAPITSTDGWSLEWHDLQCVSNKVAPFSASAASNPKISLGQGGGRNFTIFSSSVCRPTKEAELLPYQMVGGIGGTKIPIRLGLKFANTPKTSPVFRPRP